jgi:hypothetical protein
VRDYLYIGAAVLVVGYVTFTFPGWAAGRAHHRQESDRAYAAARLAATQLVINDLGRRAAELKAAELTTVYDDLVKRLVVVPTQRDWLQADELPKIRRDAEDLRARLDAVRPGPASDTGPSAEPGAPAEHHCASCGHAVAPAPFCPNCGARQALEVPCGLCGTKTLLPMHLLPGGAPPEARLFCTHCGAELAGRPS